MSHTVCSIERGCADMTGSSTEAAHVTCVGVTFTDAGPFLTARISVEAVDEARGSALTLGAPTDGRGDRWCGRGGWAGHAEGLIEIHQSYIRTCPNM